jgi:hypothetical protein
MVSWGIRGILNIWYQVGMVFVTIVDIIIDTKGWSIYLSLGGGGRKKTNYKANFISSVLIWISFGLSL